jgi:uncharacterized protein (TIGR04255 family)
MTSRGGTLDRESAHSSLAAAVLTRRHYARSPIVEAVIEIRAVLPNAVGDDALASVKTGEEERYPELLPVTEGAVNVTLDATGSTPPTTSATTTRVGFLCRGRGELFQVKRYGLSYHKLAPYSDWETCRDEAKRLWLKYGQATNPVRLIRLGLRYVNRLDLPAPGRLEDYLRTYPELAPGLPQLLSAYMMQLSIPQPDMRGTVLVMRQGLVTAPGPDLASVALDIDLAHVTDIEGQSDEVWPVFEQLHSRQIDTFESCITDKTRELIS